MYCGKLIAFHTQPIITDSHYACQWLESSNMKISLANTQVSYLPQMHHWSQSRVIIVSILRIGIVKIDGP